MNEYYNPVLLATFVSTAIEICEQHYADYGVLPDRFEIRPAAAQWLKDEQGGQLSAIHTAYGEVKVEYVDV